MAVVLGEPAGQILLGHVHAARIVVADVEHDQVAAVVILRHIVDRGGAGESVHHPEADSVLVEHGREHAAYGALLAPDFDAQRLLIPEIAAIGPGYAAGVFGGVIPG